ncbi:MAG: LbtU family siderophore porin, partial [Gammaproteobacteria bacterium]|nr:LbtU family siderophore porin [Gammaproteobacteria bacterium]
HDSRIIFGPYFYKDRLDTGSELIVNSPKIREAAFLLKRYAKLLAECNKMGVPMPKYPRLSISGNLEGTWSFTKGYNNDEKKALNLTTAEVITYLQATPWLSAFTAYDYDTSMHNKVRINMYRAYAILGDLNKFPVYTSIGQMYAPFGQYSSLMATDSFTKTLGRINALAWVLGYQSLGDNALHVEGFIYQGKAHKDSIGADLGYDFKVDQVSGKLGISGVSNMADSNGLQNAVFTSGALQSKYSVPAMDSYGQLKYKSWLLLTEYVQALKRFAKTDLAFHNHGAKPGAWHLELGYLFKTLHRPSSVSMSYGRTNQALSIGLPKQAVTMVYNISIIKNSNLALEYQHSINYAVKDASTGQDVTSLGKNSDALYAVFDYYF